VAVLSVFGLGAAAFGVTQVLASDSTGFDSSTGAVEAFFSAIDNEDGIGALETLAPGERDPLIFEVQGLASELTRLGLTKKTDLNAVPGVQLEVNDLELGEPEEIVPGVERVTVEGGSLTSSVKGGEVPIGDVLSDLIEGSGGEVEVEDSSEETEDLADFPALVTVKVDGKFHISLFHTIAESARRDMNDGGKPPKLDPAKAIAPTGGASPEEAVTLLLNAAGDLDAEAIIALLPPDEMAALQLYGQLFVEDAKEAADDAVDDGFQLDFKDMTYEVNDAGGGAKVVTPTGGTISVDVPDEGTLDVTLSGGCITVKGTGEIADTLEEEDSPFRDGEEICPDSDSEDLASDLSDFRSELGDDAANDLDAILERAKDAHLGFVVVERGGRFFVSPIRTLADPFVTVLKVFEKSNFEEGGFIHELLTGDVDIFSSEELDFDEDFSEFDEEFSDFDQELSDFEECSELEEFSDFAECSGLDELSDLPQPTDPDELSDFPGSDECPSPTPSKFPAASGAPAPPGGPPVCLSSSGTLVR
jgi:hypothetical protein